MSRKHEKARETRKDVNPDPITGAPGSHPVGTGLGAAAGGAAAGAAGGAIAGPAGAVAGAVVGGIVGGLAGKGVAEQVNPTVEHEYWRENYADRPYAERGAAYEKYAPAYQYGWEAYEQHGPGRNWDELEADLGRNWEKRRAATGLDWDRARDPARDAWERVRGQGTRTGTASSSSTGQPADRTGYRRSAEMGGKAPRSAELDQPSPAAAPRSTTERGHRGEGPCAPDA